MFAMDAFGAYGSDSDEEEQAEEAPRPMALQVKERRCLQGWTTGFARGAWALAVVSVRRARCINTGGWPCTPGVRRAAEGGQKSDV